MPIPSTCTSQEPQGKRLPSSRSCSSLWNLRFAALSQPNSCRPGRTDVIEVLMCRLAVPGRLMLADRTSDYLEARRNRETVSVVRDAAMTRPVLLVLRGSSVLAFCVLSLNGYKKGRLPAVPLAASKQEEFACSTDG